MNRPIRRQQHKTMNNIDLSGIGMTSRRTRERLIRRLQDRGIKNREILQVMMDTPRHMFVEEALAHRAYEDTALPIGYNQTISQPYIVARMTEALLAAGPLHRVLEVGTGSGYQTAILAGLVTRVFSVERILPLQELARGRMEQLGLRNIKMKHSDGGMGWPEKAPFDGIILTAAPDKLPQDLLEQMAETCRLVAPVGGSNSQQLVLYRREEGVMHKETLEQVKFVPLLSGAIS